MRLKKSHTLLTELEKETHIELHPSLILGFMGNQVIFPENNPYQNAFYWSTKQGVSLYNTNYQNKIDKTSLVLNMGSYNKRQIFKILYK